MRGSPRKPRLLIFLIALAALAGVAILVWLSGRGHPITLHGVVLRQDADPRKEAPIAEAVISAANADGQIVASAVSDSSGGFALALRRGFKVGEPLALSFRHADYRPLNLNETVADKIYVIRMLPTITAGSAESYPNATRVSNLLLRYTVKSTTDANIGSLVRTFEVANAGNVPCNGQQQCSPDGKWKASAGSFSADAGEGNEFRNVRVSCIAGPCPFTRIEENKTSANARQLHVAAQNWSDTATFLVEAEVFRPMVSNVVRNSYPVVFGRVLSFTLPTDAEGPSLEAEIGGTNIVFPLGPKLKLSWATCTAGSVEQGRAKSYRCELKPEYRF